MQLYDSGFMGDESMQFFGREFKKRGFRPVLN